MNSSNKKLFDIPNTSSYRFVRSINEESKVTNILYILMSCVISLNLFASERVIFLKESQAGSSLVLLDVKSKKETIVDTDNLRVIYPTISADGKLVAFSGSINSKDWGIYTYEISSKKITQVIADKGLTIQPSFSGNGLKLAFTAPVSGKNQIHILDYKKWKQNKSTKAHVLESDLAAYYPHMSSGGFKVTFHLSQKVNGNTVQEIAIFDIQNNKLEFLSDSNGKIINGKSPCFNLDDSKVAFISKTGADSWAIQEYDIDSKKVRNLTRGVFKDYSPRYIGTKNLLFSSNRTGQFKFYTLNLAAIQVDDSKAKVLHQGIVNIWDPRISGNIKYRQNLLKDMGGEARSSFGAVAVGDSLYVVGGHKGYEHSYPPESFSSEVYRYDSKSNSWTRLADKIEPVHGVTIAHYNGYIYAFGGFAYSNDYNPKWKSLNTIERYDIKKNKWNIVGTLPEPRSSNAIAVLDSKVYLIGGWDATPKFSGDKDGVFHKSVVVYDMKTENANYASFEVPAKPRRAFTATANNGKIIIGGGITQGGRHFDLLDEVWSIDPLTQISWNKLPNLPFANFAPAMMNVDGSLFMFGGMKLTKSGYGYVSHVYKLNNSKKSWEHTGRFLSERKGFIQPILFQGKAGLLGGHTYDKVGKDGPVKTFEIFE
jgi:Tol biopolymer transport system component/N-acetylneuraminic acid mutarotase